jgi:type IV secretion system protein VirB9
MSSSKVIPIGLILVAAAVAAPATSSAQTPGVREVTASPRTLIQLQTRLRYTTMIVLPEGEEILDVVCGDKDFWVVNATQNMAHVKPAKEGSSTNLNLVTGSGAVYSFLMTEKGGGTPDLKVYVNADPNAPKSKPKFYSAAQVEEIQGELTQARAAVEAAARHANDEITAYQQQYPGRLQFTYGTPKYEKPFLVKAIWNDGQFTYIKAEAKELPAVYEMKDGAPAVVNFQIRGDTYVVPKVLERGYLALGKERFPFQQGR